ICFFFNPESLTDFYTLSLHDALPIYLRLDESRREGVDGHPFARELLRERLRERRDPRLRCHVVRLTEVSDLPDHRRDVHDAPVRSEEHTSELQSQSNLVCRLLLEKKK